MNKAELADRIHDLKEEYHRRPMGDDLQMIKPWLEQLAFVAHIETLEEGSRSFAHLVYGATVGLKVGEGLKKIFDAVSNAVIFTSFSNQEPGGKYLFRKTLPLLMLSLISGITFIAKPDAKKVEENRQFSFDVFLHMLSSSEIVEETFSTLLDMCKCDESNKKIGVDILTLFTFLLIFEITSEYAKLSSEQLVESLKPTLKSHIDSIESYLDKTALEHAEIHILLQQAKQTLDEDETESFLHACRSALAVASVSQEEWRKDLQEAGEYSNQLHTLLREGAESDINVLTGFDQQG